MYPITLAMIARNEEHDLPSCAESVKGLISEIVLVDSFSTDGTVAAAQKLGAKVASHEFTGYAEQKNRALDMASNDWILHLDPDETLSPELREEIADLFESGKQDCDAYNIPYQNTFLGKTLNHAGLNREKHIRLFRKSKSRFGGGLVHEGIMVRGTVGLLKGRICHNSYPTLEEYFEKFNSYTTLAAKKMHENGKRFSAWKIAVVPLEFSKRYFLRLGFLDGVAGLVWSGVSAFYVFVKYAKLWKIEQDEDNK
ncbi:MAG: glycosyltransferase family 2 protein [Elusimicrobiaceae bacterium]|jgi:glycosyltransferase involved in cell wall biosynthesis